MALYGKQPHAQWSGRGRGVATDTAGGPLLDLGALFSARGGARACQLALGGAAVCLAERYAGHSGAPYGWLCLAVWCACLAGSALLCLLEVTRLHACLSVSWGDLVSAHCALATLLQLAASVLYPVYFLLPGCSWGACGSRPYRVGVTVCSAACCLAYAAELLLLARTANRGRPPPYMATPPGLLKVAQACVGGVIFGGLANGDYSRHGPARYCEGVYGACFAAALLAIGLAVSGRIRPGAPPAPPPAGARLPLDHALAVYTLLAALLYLGAAVVWPVFCLDRKHGAPARPSGCPRWGGRGRCPWDAHLVVAVFTCVNLLLYLADLACCQRGRSVPQQPLFL